MCTEAIPYDLGAVFSVYCLPDITKSAGLVMMALEVTQKCHFQMLTVTVNYPTNQDCQNCPVFFSPGLQFLS
jgi:hypothetical protein